MLPKVDHVWQLVAAVKKDDYIVVVFAAAAVIIRFCVPVLGKNNYGRAAIGTNNTIYRLL